MIPQNLTMVTLVSEAVQMFPKLVLRFKLLKGLTLA